MTCKFTSFAGCCLSWFLSLDVASTFQTVHMLVYFLLTMHAMVFSFVLFSLVASGLLLQRWFHWCFKWVCTFYDGDNLNLF